MYIYMQNAARLRCTYAKAMTVCLILDLFKYKNMLHHYMDSDRICLALFSGSCCAKVR